MAKLNDIWGQFSTQFKSEWQKASAEPVENGKPVKRVRRKQTSVADEESTGEVGNLVPLTCPKCGGSIQAPEGTNKCFCTFCGTQLFIDDGSRTVTYRTVDEARIKEAEIEKELEFKKLEIEESRRPQRLKIVALLAIVGIGMVVIGSFAGRESGDSDSPWYMVSLIGYFPLLCSIFAGVFLLPINRK